MKALCGRNCDKCVYRERCGGCSMCEACLCSGNCKKCFALCPKRPGAAAYFSSIGGPTIQLRPNSDIELTEHIPILPDRLTTKPDYELMPVIGIHAGNAFSSSGEKVSRLYREKGYAAALNIDERTKAILEWYVKDRTLEGFWDKRETVYPVLRDMGFEAVIAPNFSVYEDSPRMDHMYNIKRSSIVYNELLDAGIKAIPDISWFNKNDLDKWCGEINKNNIKLVAFSFQVVDVRLKPSNIWRTYLSGFRYLCQQIDKDVKIIIAGLISPYRIQEVYNAASGHSVHVLNQSAYIQSRRGMLSETRQQERHLAFDEIFKRNLQYFNIIYTQMNCNALDSQGNLFEKITSWDKEKLKEFYLVYSSGAENLTEKFEIQEKDIQLAQSIVARQIKKKRIKLGGQTKCLNQGEVEA